MDETSEQGLETKNPNEDEGGIRRRLRDRNLLRKRKAEAEEKETNQWVFGVESPNKRSKATVKSSSKKRGRPRKLEPVLSVVQEKEAVIQEDPGVELVPEAAGTIPDQKTSSPTPTPAVESEPAPSVVSVQSPVFVPTLSSPAVESEPAPSDVSVQSPVFVPTLSSPAVESEPAPSVVSVQSPVFVPTLSSPALVNPVPDVTTIQDSAPQEIFLSPVLSQDTTLYPSPAPQQLGNLYAESQNKEVFNQILIQDSGPNDETNKAAPEEEKTGEGLGVEDLSETRLMTEQSKMYPLPSFSSMPLSEEYLPGN